MSKEQESIRVTTIRIALEDQSVTLDSSTGPLAKLTFSSGSIYFQAAAESPSGAPISDAISLGGPRSHDTSPTVADPEDIEPQEEKQRPVVLQGRLLGRVREGRPDSRGRKTAWARFAAHEDGQDKPHLYSATFHRGSAAGVLALPADSRLVVEGYVHQSNDPEGERMDTLSVFRLLKRTDTAERPAE